MGRAAPFVLAMGLAPSLAFAQTITLSWNPTPEARSYIVQQSRDQGQTWEDVAQTQTPNATAADLTPPHRGLTLYRVLAVFDGERIIRYEAGAWYNPDWRRNPPDALRIE